jgi:hypothetical protein
MLVTRNHTIRIRLFIAYSIIRTLSSVCQLYAAFTRWGIRLACALVEDDSAFMNHTNGDMNKNPVPSRKRPFS